MANNDGYIDVISKIKPANRDGFKIADAKDVEYPEFNPETGVGKVNKNREQIVNDVGGAIDALYDIISATPTFYLVSNSKIPSNGSDRVYVQIGTSSPQGNTVKITITNKTTGGSIQYSGPINSVHTIDLGVISTYGTYEYTVTAVDNFNNAMVVDLGKSSPGSFDPINEGHTNETQYQLKFNLIAGSIKYNITSVDKVATVDSPIINESSKIYEADTSGNTKFDITVRGSLQYPEIHTDGLDISEYAKYTIKSRCVYMYYTDDNRSEYMPIYKYLYLRDLGILRDLQSYNLLYKLSKNNENDLDTYVDIDAYNRDEASYSLNEYDASVGILYGFVKNTNQSNNGEFKKITNNGVDTYEYVTDATSGETYDCVPVYRTADFYNAINGEANPKHLKSSENLIFTIPDVFLINEAKYSISVITSIDKTYVGEETENLSSIEISSNIYPIYIEREAGTGNTLSLKVIPTDSIVNPNTDQDLSTSFMLISTHNRIKSNIKFRAQLFYRPANTFGDNDLELKNIVREGCANLSEQTWIIGRVSKGSGHYYFIITPTSYDGSLSGTPYEYHFNVVTGSSATTPYSHDGLVAYWDAVKMSNDMKNPNMWYPTVFSGANEVESSDFYIKLSGLNYNTNGWVQYDNANGIKQPHLKFTGDSYGLAYRLNSSGEEEPLSIIDLLDSNKIPAYSDDTRNKEMSFEIMFRTRCVGEMKACVVSSREEESRALSLYTYSDADEQRANSGITISHNKAIINTNKDYMSAPFNSDEWKHIVITVNRNINTTLASKGEVNYNPFSSMKIYIDGILTSVTDIPEIDTDSNVVFDRFTQMVLNGHLGLGNVIENCGSSEIRLIRLYNKALSNKEVVNNFIDSIYDINDRTVYETKNSDTVNTIPIIYFVKNSVGEDDSPDNIRKDDTKNSTFNRLIQITDKKESKEYFVNCTMYYTYPIITTDEDGKIHTDMKTETYNNVDVYLQGTSTLQFPVKNFKIRTYKNVTEIDANGNKVFVHGGKAGAKKLKMIPPNMEDEWVEDSTFTLKCDYMESGHMNNTPTAKYYHHVVRELIDAGIDGSNPNVYQISKKDYRFQQDSKNGTYKINKKSEYELIEDPASYTGPKYRPIEITQKNSASPSRSYFAFVENDDGTIYYTSALDTDPTYGKLKYIDSETNIIYNNEEEYSAAGLESTDVKGIYDKPNRYYIRNYNSSYTKLQWVEYDPTNENHYGKILYKINDMYRDSIDGFPCIVYYSDTFMGYTNDTTQAQIDGKLTLLGTMMFNLDKGAKSLGFTVNPVFENDYYEYLKSYYYKYVETNQLVINDINSLEEFIEYGVSGVYNSPEHLHFINSYTQSNGGIIQTIYYSVPDLLSFIEFYNGDETNETFVEYKKIKVTDDDYPDIFEDKVKFKFARSLYGKLNGEYIAYPNLTSEELISLKNSSSLEENDVWYTKSINEDLYATAPVYTYEQHYIEDSNGNYYLNDDNQYVLADKSYTGTRYKQVFDDIRTYNTKSNGDFYRTTDQCVLSYEATTNTKYAAGTFYDIDEAYTLSYDDDFLNQYYSLYFTEYDEITPKSIRILGNNGLYSEISPKAEDNSLMSLDNFKTYMKNTLHMDAIVLSEWTNTNFFYLDETRDDNGNLLSIDPGPYVYIVNGVITKTDTANGTFALYDKSVHDAMLPEGVTSANNYRYKFGLKIKSASIEYVQDSNGTYYLDDNDKYKLIQEGVQYSGTKYRRELGTDSEFIINDKRSYIGDKLSGSDESYLDYMMGSFETRFSYVDENDVTKKNMPDNEKDNNSWLPLKNLIKWVIESVKATGDNIESKDTTKNIFRKEFRDHIDLTYAITYYLQMILFAQADNAGKNSMWDTWDGKKFYIRPYDMDTQSGLNNKGLFNVPTSAEVNKEQSPTEFTDNTSTHLGNISNRLTDGTHLRYNSYTTATSRFWNSFAKAFKDEIISAYALLRNSGMYTSEYILNYFKEHVTDCIGEKYYNEDMNAKYLSQSKLDYLGLLMGNRLDQFSKWISERIIFCDTYFNYIENDTLNTQLDIRAQTTNSTAAIGISVFSPQYVKISVGSTRDAVFTAYVDNNSTYTYNGITYEGVLFTLPITGNNKEISIYGGGNIKEINNIGDLKASTLNLGNARKITKLEIAGNNYIESLSLTNAVYLRSLNVSNCSKLTGNLDVSNSINLQTLDISSSALSGVTLASGGNLKSFIARNTAITSIEFINLQQLTDIIISNSSGLIPISTYTMRGCPLIKTINLDGFTNISKVSVANCDNLSSLYIEGNQSLSDLVIESCNNLHVISLKNTSGSVLENLQLNTVYGLDKLDITSCRPANGIHIIFPYFKDAETAGEPSEEIGYSDRWHNLKNLLCTSSTLKCISYGTNDDNTNIVDLSPLDMLKGIIFTYCDKITSINGLKYDGNPAMFNGCSKLETITNSYIYRTIGSTSSMFYYCSKLNDFSSLNINQYAKYDGSTAFSSTFYGGRSTEPMIKSMVYSGRDFTLKENSESLNNITGYSLRDYLVRDTTPHYTSIRLASDDLYVYTGDNDTSFVEYNTYLHNMNQLQDYRKENDPNLHARYYKVYTTNGSNRYINDSFGLYMYINNDKSSVNSYYFTKISNVDYELGSGESLNSLPSSYKTEGTIIKESSTSYAIYLNGSWKRSNVYSFFDVNTLDMKININDSPQQAPGGIYEELGNSPTTFKFYMTTSQSPYSVYTTNGVNPSTEYITDGRYSNRSNDTDNINYKYYRIYNPSIDSINKVLKKEYINTTGNKYASSISTMCYARANSTESLSIKSDTLDGLQKCTNSYYAFASSGLTSFDYHAFWVLENLTNATRMFSNTGLTTMRKELFEKSTKLKDCSGMFSGCSNLTGFVTSNNVRCYYNTDNDGIITSILPVSLEYMQQMFAGCSKLGMSGNDLNGFLSGLSNVTLAWQAFRACTAISHMRNKPLASMTKLKDISSMFMDCTSLNVQNVLSDNTTSPNMLMDDPNNEFSLVDISKDYPDLKYAYGLFYGCTNLKGFISKYIFGTATYNENGIVTSRSGAYNITNLGCDLNITSTTADSSGHITTGGAEAPRYIGGAFANTGIYSYHEEFLAPLSNLKDVSSLFAKINSSGTICKNSENISLCTAMYGFGRTGEGNRTEIYSGISDILFEHNPYIENASYLFAGNKALERTSSEIGENFSVPDLPNLFKYCSRIKYLIGAFMYTTFHSEELTKASDGGGYVMDNKYFIHAKAGSSIDTNNFFKYYNSNTGKFEGFSGLKSIRSIFENSNYTPYSYDEGNSGPKISKDMFKGCTSLSDVSKMFRHNEYISGDEIIPIELFDDCRNSISNVSYMFQGCCGDPLDSLNKGITGALPTGDNTWLLAYNRYLEDIKSDPDVITVYPSIANLSIGQLFDSLLNGEYKSYPIRCKFETTMRLLDFNEFVNEGSLNKLIGTITNPGGLTVTTSNGDSSIPMEPGYYISNSKYSSSQSGFSVIHKIEDAYFVDRETITLPSTSSALNSYLGSYIINNNEVLIQLTSQNISNYRGSTVNKATFGELGIYGYVTETEKYELIRDLGSSYNGARYVKRTKISLSIDNSSADYILNRQVFNIYECSGDPLIITSTNSGNAAPIYRNRRVIAIPGVTSQQDLVTESGSYLHFYINGEPVQTYNISDPVPVNESPKRYFIGSPEILSNTVYSDKYTRGLLGSCSKLESAAHMFEGCLNINGRVPKDIFSAESPGTYLNKLTDISYMFSSCPLLATIKVSGINNVVGNPITMYERDSSYNLVDSGENLVPEDWLSNATNIVYAQRLFSRIATFDRTIVANRPNVNSSTDIDRYKSVSIPNRLFGGLRKVQSISYIFYGSPLLVYSLTNEFLRDSLSTLTDVSFAFSHTTLNNIGTSDIRIFELSGLNNKLENVSGTFWSCQRLNNDNSYYPRFASGSKFSKIITEASKRYCFSSTGFTLPAEYDIFKGDAGNNGYWYDGTSGYYFVSLSPEALLNTLV